MPMVTDTSEADVVRLPIGVNGNVTSYLVAPSGRRRHQWGYRTQHLSPGDKQELDLGSEAQWKDTYKVVQTGNGGEYGRHMSLSSSVNQREYSETRYSPGPLTSDAWYVSRHTPHLTGKSSWLGALSIEPSDAAFGTPVMPEAEQKAIASSLMRQSVPTAPEVNLLRFIGELRDAPQFAKLGNYIPHDPRHYGDAYLNYVFGVAPTVDDLMRVAEAVDKSSKIVNDYVAHERRQVRRSSVRNIVSYSGSGSYGGVPGPDWKTNLIPSGGGPSAGLLTITGAPRLNWCSSDLSWDIVATEQIRSFATFQYFVPRPSGLMGRLETYLHNAQKLLGVEFNTSTAYDLTRWSWVADWFVDIGGLLRYQEAVSGANVVASRSGFVYERSMSVAARAFARNPDGVPPTSTGYIRGGQTISGSASASIKLQTRQPGGPYSILQPWGLNGTQAAVVGALGLSRLPRV